MSRIQFRRHSIPAFGLSAAVWLAVVCQSSRTAFMVLGNSANDTVMWRIIGRHGIGSIRKVNMANMTARIMRLCIRKAISCTCQTVDRTWLTMKWTVTIDLMNNPARLDAWIPNSSARTAANAFQSSHDATAYSTANSRRTKKIAVAHPTLKSFETSKKNANRPTIMYCVPKHSPASPKTFCAMETMVIIGFGL